MPQNSELLQKFDWARSAIGARSCWSVAQNANIAMLMASDFPMCSVWGPDHIQIYNDGYNAIFGAKHPDAFGSAARTSWAEIWQFLGPALDEVMDGSTLTFSEELLPLVKSSLPEECYFDFSCSPIRDLNGRIEGILFVAAERTSEVVLRRRQKLFQLDAAPGSENAFEAIVQTLHDVLSENEMDCKVAILFSADADTGAPDGEIWTLRADPSHSQQFRTLAANALRNSVTTSDWAQVAGNSRQVTSIPIYSINGDPCCALVIAPSELVPYESSFLPFSGAISRSVHAALHAAERHQREVGQMRERIAEQEQLYQFLFENIQDGIAYCATTGLPGDEEIILAVNARLCEMLGYRATEIVGMSRDAIFLPSDRALQDALEKRSVDRGFRGKLNICARDGRLIPVELSSNLIEFRKGETRSLSLIRDLSHHEKTENERIERIRMETIANLSSSLAHDTNNLMTIVIGSAELLADTLPNGGAEQQLAVNAIVAAERACGLTNQLLTFSRPRPPATRPTDINAFLAETKPLIASALGEINTLTMTLDANLPLCLTDRTQLTTALLNFATNARHAMPEGGSLSIETFEKAAAPSTDDAEAGPAGQRFVGVRVTDSGSGIPPELQGRVFEPFFTTKEVGRGSGLGLSIVDRFMKELDGTLSMTSAPGRGTTFELGFRAVENENIEDGGAEPEHWTKGDVVLYVEDNEIVRRQTVVMLQQIGAEPVVFANGRKALEWVKAGGQAALLLTDLVLPGDFSGRELATAVRRFHPDIPVIITTGYDPEGTIEQIGYRQYRVLHKPYTRRTLRAAMLQQRRAS